MDFWLLEEQKYKRTIAFFSAIFLLLASAAAMLGQLGLIFVPCVAGFYATILTFESKCKRIMSYVLPPLAVGVEILFYGFYSCNCLFAIAIGFVIYFSAKRRFGKWESAYVVTAIYALLFLVSFFLAVVLATGKFSVSAVTDYYQSFFDTLRNGVVEFLLTLSAPASDGSVNLIFNEQTANQACNSIFGLIVAYVLIIAFFLAGISFKTYSSLVIRYAKETEPMLSWRFSPSPFFAYTYCIVTVIHFFSSGEIGIFSMTVSTLYLLLMVAFAYVGLLFVNAYLSYRFNRGAAKVLLIIAVLLFSSLAIELLSFVGVFIVIMSGKFSKMKNDFDGTKK